MMVTPDRAAVVLLATWSLLPAVAAAETSASRQKPVVLPTSGTTTLVAVRLDADVHALANDGYGDLRILDGAGTETPFMMVSHTALLEDHPVCRFRVVPEPDGKATRISIDTLRAPVSEIRIETASRNFSRAVRVGPPEDAGRGRPDGGMIGAGMITRIDVAGVRTEQMTIPVRASRLPIVELVIDDGDSPPIDVTGITTRGPARDLLFLAEPGATYRLAYGGDLAAPRYDTAAIRAASGAGVATLPAALGPESVGALPAARPAPVWLLADGRFQFGVILVLVVILAAALFRAARRIDASPPSPE